MKFRMPYEDYDYCRTRMREAKSLDEMCGWWEKAMDALSEQMADRCATRIRAQWGI